MKKEKNSYTLIRYLKNYDNLPIVIKIIDNEIKISFVNNTKFSDEKIHKAVEEIIKKEIKEL